MNSESVNTNYIYYFNVNILICYFLQVKVGEESFIIIKVFQSLNQKISLTGYQLDKKKDDPIHEF